MTTPQQFWKKIVWKKIVWKKIVWKKIVWEKIVGAEFRRNGIFQPGTSVPGTDLTPKPSSGGTTVRRMPSHPGLSFRLISQPRNKIPGLENTVPLGLSSELKLVKTWLL